MADRKDEQPIQSIQPAVAVAAEMAKMPGTTAEAALSVCPPLIG